MPTAALPGSPEKICVLAERARLGLPLFHPLDVQIPLGSTPMEQGPTDPDDLDWSNQEEQLYRYRQWVRRFQEAHKVTRPMPQWLVTAPDDTRVGVFSCWTSGEARALAKVQLGLRPRERLPVGYRVERVRQGSKKQTA